MRKVGVIDIGSNSIRLVLIEVEHKNYFRIIDDVKETVRLGMDMLPNGELNAVRMNRAINTLAEFKLLCDAQGISELLIVATEAVRRASNQNVFLQLVQAKLGIAIRVLTGPEEAYYDYFGVINSMDLRDGLIMDVGGASTELIWVQHRKAKAVISLPFGAINLTRQFNLTQKMNSDTEKELNKYLMSQFAKVTWLKQVKNIPLIGVGGTVRNIGKISRKSSNYPIDRSHNYQIDAHEVLAIYNMVKDKTLEQRKKVKGLSKERSDMFLGASSVAANLINYCNAPHLIVSGSGLREGLIYETLHGHKAIHDVLDYSLKSVVKTLNIDQIHGQHVWLLAESLYRQLKPLHKIIYHSDKILKTSAILNDCGKIINFYNYHKHTFYMITNLPINGLTHKELIISALTMLVSVKDNFELDNSPYGKLLTEEDKSTVQRLGIILRLAECLDRRRNRNIINVDCQVKSDSVLIRLISHAPSDGEQKDVSECSVAFAKIFGKPLLFE
ncbi:MAG: Ppx/GppA phosphatase family protein [Peptococcaceae bacterium]|nr:Ppx/GppA phosphatase family protein [Peptococcaceae bacterium]